MDISGIKPTAQFLEILNPDGSGRKVGIRLELVSIDDDRLKAARRHIQDRQMHLSQRGKTFTPEQIEKNAIDLQAKTITGWTWYNPTGEEGDDGYDPSQRANFKGNDNPPCTYETVREVLTEVRWFASQVSDMITDTERFFQN